MLSSHGFLNLQNIRALHRTLFLLTDIVYHLTSQMKLFKLWMMTPLQHILTYLWACWECNLIVHLPSLHKWPTSTTTTTTTSDPDWAQLAEEAIHNADLGKGDPLPLAPEVIIVKDKNDTPFPPALKKKILLFPKLNLTCYLPHKLFLSLCHHLEIINIQTKIAHCLLNFLTRTYICMNRSHIGNS
jgi:hypothetical protein